MGAKIVIFAVLAQILTATAWEQPKEPFCPDKLAPKEEIVIAGFKAAYNKIGTVYRPQECARNIKELLLDLVQNHEVDIAHTKVILLLHEYRRYAGGPIAPDLLQPARSRRNSLDWKYHVVLRYDDPITGHKLILDLDGPANGLTMDEYFNHMFPSGSGQDRLQNIRMREIDSARYLRAFEDYLRTHDPRHGLVEETIVINSFIESQTIPATTVREYLQRSK